MEIQQLQVKITAEMSGLRKALDDFKKGFAEANKRANDTERALSSMSANASKGFDSMHQAIERINADLKVMKEEVRSVFDFRPSFGDKDIKIFKVDSLRKELAQAEDMLSRLYQRLDNLHQQLENAPPPEMLKNIYYDIDGCSQAAEMFENKVKGLKITLMGLNDAKGKSATTAELEAMKEKAYEAEKAFKAAEARLAELRGQNPFSDATGAATKEYSEAAYKYMEAMTQLKNAQNAVNAQGIPSFWNKLGHATGSVASALSKIGHVAAQAAKGLGKLWYAGFQCMRALNPIPRVVNKLGSAFKSLWHKIKTAFIFSVVNSWFHNFRNQVASYLKTNAELQAALSGFKGAALTAFQPIYEAMIPALITLVNWLTAAISALARFFAMLGGKSVGTMRANAKALNEQAKATSAAGGAAADAAKTIAAFDELNVLNGDKGGGGGGSDDSAAILFPDIEEGEEFSTWGEAFSKLLDKLLAKLPDFDEALQKVANKINEVTGKLVEMFEFPGVQEKVSKLGEGLAESLNHFLDTVNWRQLGNAIGDGIQTAINFCLNYEKTFNWHGLGESLAESLNGVIEKIKWDEFGELLIQKWNLVWQTFDGFIETFNWRGLGSAISASFTSMLKNIDLASTGSALSGGLRGILNAIAQFFEDTDWKTVGETIVRKFKEMITNIDWEDIIASLYEAAGAATGGTVRLATTLAEKLIQTFIDGWHEAQEYFQKEIENCGGSIIGGIFTGIDNAITTIKIWILTHIYGPFIKGFMEAFGISSATGGEFSHSSATVPIGESVMGGILKGIQQGFANIGRWFSTTFQSIRTWVSTTWDNIKTNTVTKWENIKTAIVTKVEEIRTKVTTKFNEIKTKVETVNEQIKTKISTKWNELKTKVTTTVEQLSTSLSTKWETIKTTVTGKVEDLKEEVKRKYEALKTHLSTLTDALGLDIGPKWEKIKTDIISVAEAIRDAVGQAFEKVKEGIVGAFTSAKELIKAPINEIIGFINRMISGICQGINNMIYALNQLDFTLPDWVPLVGGSHFGLNINYVGAPQIPLLANGGVITDPTMAVLGEYAGANSNPEIVAPQDLLKSTMVEANGEMIGALYQMAQMVVAAIEDMDMNVTIGDDTIASSAKRGADNYRRRTGKPMFA